MVRNTGNSVADSEIGTIKKSWKGRISVALVYPNHYGVGMSNLGFQSIYQILNSFDTVVCERAFLPEPTRAKHSGKHSGLFSIESGRKLTDFHIIAFSVSFENDFPNILSIIDKTGLPLQSNARGDSHPLIIAGGVACFLNPEPISEFIDCFLIGEGESLFTPFFKHYSTRSDRKSILKALAVNVPGAYVPEFYTPSYNHDGTLKSFIPNCDVPLPVKKIALTDLSDVATSSVMVSPEAAFDSSWLIEVSRGCPHGCRFCSAGFVYRPPRQRSVSILEKQIQQGLDVTNKIGLVGTAISDHPEIGKLCSAFGDKNVRFSYSSLRADSITPDHISVLQKSGTKTATIAPDAGSERMRRVINKGLNEETILSAAETLVNSDIPNLKLYFMIGLPGETPEDINEIIALCKKIKTRFVDASRKKGRIGTISVSISSFVPKPFTPFQWAAMDTRKSLKKKIKTLKGALGKIANVSIVADSPRWSLIQALMARGDRRVSTLLINAFHNKGNWAQTLKESSIDIDFYIHRERPQNELFPWDFIDHGINKEYLLKEYRKSVEEKASPPCPGIKCNLCGVCSCNTPQP